MRTASPEPLRALAMRVATPDRLLGLPGPLARRPETQAIVYVLLELAGALGRLGDQRLLELRTAYGSAAASNRPRLEALHEILCAASRAGIRLVPIKGAGLQLTHYRDPGARPMQDLDLVCRPGDLRPAVRLLEALGFRARAPDPFRVAEQAHHDLRLHRGRVLVELHFRLWHELRIGSAVDALVDHAEEISVSGTRVLVPRAADHLYVVLVHAALHVFAGNGAWLFDAALLADRAGKDLWDEVEARAVRAGSELPLAAARDHLSLVLPDAQRPRPGWRPAPARRRLLRLLAPWLQQGEATLGLLPSRLLKPLLIADGPRLLDWSREKLRILHAKST